MFEDDARWLMLVACAAILEGTAAAILSNWLEARRAAREEEEDEEEDGEEDRDPAQAVEEAEKRLAKKIARSERRLQAALKTEIANLRRDIFGPWRDV